MFTYKWRCKKCMAALNLNDTACPNCKTACQLPFSTATVTSPDSNVEKNRQMLLNRSLLGQEKYGFATDTNPLTMKQWLQHALEEALGMANYLQAAITKIEEEDGNNENV